MRDTVLYLREYATEIMNDRGLRIAIASAVDTEAIIKIVVFKGGVDLPLNCVRHRFHGSRTAGFIHVIAASDWHNIMHTLVTPREIADYLRMRESMSRAHAAQVRAVSEKALVGQFIADAHSAPPTAAFEGVVDRVVDDRESFDILRFLNLFGDRIISDAPPGTITLADLHGADVVYYPIIRELAKLPRTDVAAFKERFELARLGGLSKCWRGFANMGPRTVFTPADFVDLGPRNAVDLALSRKAHARTIRKLARVSTTLPRRDARLGDLSPSQDGVAAALAGRDGARLQASGPHAANLLGSPNRQIGRARPRRSCGVASRPTPRHRTNQRRRNAKEVALPPRKS